MPRFANTLILVALTTLSTLATATFAQDAAPALDNPKAQLFADQLLKSCESEFLASIPQLVRDDAGKDASPALIEEMVAVSREGMCECFVSTVRKQPDERVGASFTNNLEPQFKSCIAAALKPRMARICTETQRTGADDSAPDCGCMAEAVAALDDDVLGAGANNLFDVLDSTRDIPASAGALGEAARGCAAKR